MSQYCGWHTGGKWADCGWQTGGSTWDEMKDGGWQTGGSKWDDFHDGTARTTSVQNMKGSYLAEGVLVAVPWLANRRFRLRPALPRWLAD